MFADTAARDGAAAPGEQTGRRRLVLGLAATALALAGLILTAGGAGAQEADTAFDNSYCLGCHSNEGMQTTLPSGEVLPLTFDVDAHEASVHGPFDIPCVLCHTNITSFPHEAIDVPDLRAWTLERNSACANCHEDTATTSRDNVHSAALGDGMREAAVCTDCHGAHDILRPIAHTPEVAMTCRECHSQVFDIYRDSVHGAALIDGNREVPTCTDCHGVHDVEGPSRPQFHLFSPEICARCHEDEQLMAKYDISTEVFETYVADFHGTTVVLFEELAPDQETNKPVCIDCHGVHSIQSAADPHSSTFRENLLGTCQRCHPDATANFPASWLSHYTPSPGTATVVWIVTMFYKIVIPVVIGAMLAYVALFAIRGRLRRRGGSHA